MVREDGRGLKLLEPIWERRIQPQTVLGKMIPDPKISAMISAVATYLWGSRRLGSRTVHTAPSHPLVHRTGKL